VIFNDLGELLKLALTSGNVDDRKPVPKLVKELFNKLFGDIGYITRSLFELLLETFNFQLIA
jgi:hypothetical protein